MSRGWKQRRRRGYLPGIAGGLMLLATLAAAQEGTAALYTDAPKVVWGNKLEVATGEAFRGPWRMNDSDFRYLDDPTVAINEQGVVGVAWADQARQDIFFQAFAPDGSPRFEAPVNVSQSPRIFSWLPRLVMASGNLDKVYVLWQEIVFSGGSHGGEIFFARSSDGGRSFSEPLNLSNTPAGDGKGRLTRRFWHNGSLDLVLGQGGQLFAAWTEFEGALWVSRSTDGGQSFSPPLRVVGQGVGAPARGPSLAVDPAGVIYLAWAVGEDPAANIHFAKSTDQGASFSPPRPILISDAHADAPKIAVDGKGILHLVYAQSPAGPLQRYYIYYSRSSDGGRTFEQPREIAGPQTGLVSVHFPALSVDEANNLYVLWELYFSGVPHPRGLGFTYSGDGGLTFAPASVIPGSIPTGQGVNGSLQGLLMRKLAVNPAGAIAIVNSTFWHNERSQVWLLRGQAHGR